MYRVYSISREERGDIFEYYRENVYSIGVRDVPYGIWFPCVRVAWDVDILGKFRRRCGLADHRHYEVGLVL